MLLLLLVGYILILLLLIQWNVYVALGFILVTSVVMKVFMPTIKGYIGERRINQLLAKLGPEYKVYHDLYVEKTDGRTSQLDHVVLSRYGIFVIETKNYSGWIFGSEQQKNWTQVIYKNKQKFYNPIMQNKTHIRALQNFLSIDDHFYSIIVFANGVTFKFKSEFTQAYVIKNAQLNKTIKKFQVQVLSDEQLQMAEQKLQQLTAANQQNKTKIKREHIRQIENNKNAPKKKSTAQAKQPTKPAVVVQTEQKTCAQCGEVMVFKKGRYGAFYGCSNYPSCRHTEKYNGS